MSFWTNGGGGHVCRRSRRSVYRRSHTNSKLNSIPKTRFSLSKIIIIIKLQKAHKERKKTQRKVTLNPTLSCVENVKLLRAKAGHVVPPPPPPKKKKKKKKVQRVYDSATDLDQVYYYQHLTYLPRRGSSFSRPLPFRQCLLRQETKG